MRTFIIILLASLAGGCASANMSPAQSAELQTLKIQPDYQEKIKAVVDAELKDPYSAHYRFTEPRKAYFTTGLIYGGGVVGVGFGEVVLINAKNSFGGYVGEQPYYFVIFSSGEIKEEDESTFNVFVHFVR